MNQLPVDVKVGLAVIAALIVFALIGFCGSWLADKACDFYNWLGNDDDEEDEHASYF